MSARIFITGVAGFIGSNLADSLLADGFEVAGVDDLSQGPRAQVPRAVQFHQLDVRSPELFHLLHAGDVVFHLAAKNCISDCQADPVETASVNVLGTTNVLEAARRAGAAKVIYAESSALYEGAETLPTPEAEVRPQSFYGVSKAASAMFADAYRRYYGLRLTALRYFCVYGPRQDYRRTIPPVMSAFALRLLRGERPVIFGTGQKRRDFVHVDDVNRFHRMCIADGRTDNATFNLGSGTSYSIAEIYERIAELIGTSLVPEHRPDLPGEAPETRADISAARKLGWEPKVDLDAGLRDLVRYYRENPLLWQS